MQSQTLRLSLVVLLLLNAGCRHIVDKAPPTTPTRDEVAISWIGSHEPRGTLFRLDLKSDGTGSLGEAAGYREASVEYITKWTIDGTDIKITFQNKTNGLFASGQAEVSGKRLEMDLLERPQVKIRLTLWPESAEEQRRLKLREAMNQLYAK